MTNLLPQDAKREVKRFYRARIVTAFSLVLLFGALLSALALAPAHLIATLPDTASAAQIKAPPPGSDQAAIQRAQQLLRDLTPLSGTTTPALNAVRSVLAARTEGIVITDISFDHGTIALQGSGPSRDAVSSYAAALRSDPRFKQVSVPLSALTASGQSAFSITISGTF